MVVVYTSPTCAPCRMVKSLFNKFNVEYEERDVSDDKNAENAFKLAQTSIVPVVVADDDVIVGYQPQRLVPLLRTLAVPLV